MSSQNTDFYHLQIARHPLFRAFNEKENSIVKEYYQIVSVPESAVFIFPGDSMDSLFLVLSGQVCRGRNENTGRLLVDRTFLPGDYWGVESFFETLSEEFIYQTRDETVLMRFTSEAFRRLLKDSPSLIHHFRPRTEGSPLYISGMSKPQWQELKKLTAHQKKKGGTSVL